MFQPAELCFVKVKSRKAKYTVFSLLIKEQNKSTVPQLDCFTFKEYDCQTYLGLTFDLKLIWKTQLKT